MNSTVTLEVLLMNPYYRYKKEKFLEKYQSAYDNLEDLKEAIAEYKKIIVVNTTIILNFHI